MNAIIIFIPLNDGDFPNHPEIVVSPFANENAAQEWINDNRTALNKKYPGALGWSYSIHNIKNPLNPLS